MFHTWWFQMLLLVLTLNIIVCSIERLSSTWKIIFTTEPSFNISRFRRLRQKEEFADNRSPDLLVKEYEPFIKRRFRRSRIEETESGFAIFGEKGRWSRLGVYAVHLSVVLLSIGGLVSLKFGFEGFVNIPEGETVQQVRVRNSGEMHRLDFEIRCDDFDVSFYDTGAPKEFRSSLTILKDGKPVFQKNIIVNDPLHYDGINFFQSSYGMITPKEAILNFTSQASGTVYKKKAVIGAEIALPENLGTFILRDFSSSTKFRGHDIGEAFSGTLSPPGKDPVEVQLPLRFPSFDKMRRGDVIIAIEEYVPRYYTGLQVTRDPSVWIVYSGFILMILGCYITFFMSHQQIYIEVVEAGGKSRVSVAGTANKNKLGMQRKVQKIAERLSQPEQTS
jgi:cytochrome c biogenesis protein